MFLTICINTNSTRRFIGCTLICVVISVICVLYQLYASNLLYSTYHYENTNTFNVSMIFDPALPQNDSRLLDITRNKFLIPPSSKEYNLSYKWGRDPGKLQTQTDTVMQILRQKRNGFFIECGANDGEYLSSTLILERDFGWTGLLVEPDPYAHSLLLSRNRKAWTSPVCLSTKPYPEQVTFQHSPDSNGAGSHIKAKGLSAIEDSEDIKNTTCLPLFTLLSALRITIVDYFCLDVEGVELKVLKTIPFDSVLIKVLSIEFNHIPEGANALKSFMESKGYIFTKQISRTFTLDYVFTHKSVT